MSKLNDQNYNYIKFDDKNHKKRMDSINKTIKKNKEIANFMENFEPEVSDIQYDVKAQSESFFNKSMNYFNKIGISIMSTLLLSSTAYIVSVSNLSSTVKKSNFRLLFPWACIPLMSITLPYSVYSLYYYTKYQKLSQDYQSINYRLLNLQFSPSKLSEISTYEEELTNIKNTLYRMKKYY